MPLFFFINKDLSCIIQLGRDHVILVANAVLWPWRDKYVRAENRKMLTWKAVHTAHWGLVEIHFTIFFNSVVCTGHRLNFNWKTNQNWSKSMASDSRKAMKNLWNKLGKELRARFRAKLNPRYTIILSETIKALMTCHSLSIVLV